MMSKWKLVCALILTGFVSPITLAQESGIPGDGVADFYYFQSSAEVATSVGVVSRPAGTLLVDTDGANIVAMLIGGPDGTGANCELCNQPNLPDPAFPPFFASSWTSGFINQATQFVRTAPLDGDGFVGVIGEYEDPFDIFPDFGVTNYGPGLSADDFTKVFETTGPDAWNVTYSANSEGTFFTNVTVVPEPTALVSLFGALVGVGVLRRRRS